MQEIDAVVVGAGFCGLYSIYKLREIGISVVAFERGPDVGGVWYWNTYPGARCDADSLAYSFSFSEELQQEWQWPERFSAQPDILKYAQHVADRFDLRRHISFGVNVTSATWDEAQARWLISTDQGDVVSARYFVIAAGGLSAGRVPDFPGLKDFAGEWYHTGAWPRETIDFTGKKVVVVGTGSSGIQAIPRIAEQASHLTVLQRTANYSVPARNGPIDPDYEKEIKDNYVHHRQLVKDTGLGFLFPKPVPSKGLTKEQREAEFQSRWDKGGPLFMFSFQDMMVNRSVNDEGAEFIRRKIREAVVDPEKAAILCPEDYPVGAKRICVDIDYFETYNRDNVSLVDVKKDPIDRFTTNGVTLKSGKTFDVDRIVFATGYDALTGPLLRMDIRGRHDMPLAQKWAAGPLTYLGLLTEGFPNMFIPTGPGSPSAVGNVIVGIEQHVDFIISLMLMMRERECNILDTDPQYERDWVQHVNDLANSTLWPQADSWYLGANIPGKPRVFMPYVGGSVAFRRECDAIALDGFKGFVTERHDTVLPPEADQDVSHRQAVGAIG